jgi:hypothetical protein
MSTNQQVILETLLDQKRQELDETLSINDYFHLFVTEQVLKNYALSYDEISEGIVDSGGDGGIDSIYTFVNSELIQRDSELIDAKRNATIDVFLIQSKNTNGFGETPLDKCIASADDLFDLAKPIDELRSVYNISLLTNIDTFRKQLLKLSSKFPELHFHYFYATRGTDVHPNVERKVFALENKIKGFFDKAAVEFQFLTAQKLLELARKKQLTSKDILLNDNPISTQDGGYVAIVPIKHYFDFITNENHELIRYFFDANIRDYQGKVEVNKAIKETLNSSANQEDFWWLNNGVTITATQASYASKRLHIEDPQIVNGLQTSFEIFEYFTTNKIERDDRNILIRVISPKSEKSRLAVIKATNSQTNVPPASLRATDPIHKDLEDYLLANSFYYDRRKNYYKNQGKPINKIISIPYLAQIIMSIYLQEPDYARARPSTLIKKDEDYRKIFDPRLPISIYLKGIQVQRIVEEALKSWRSPALSRNQIGDIKFHVAMYITCRICKNKKPRATEISMIDPSSIDKSVIEEAIENVYIIYDAMGGDNSVAKGREFVKETLAIIDENINRLDS